MAKDKKPIDWAGIERDFCKSTSSIREIARWFGCSDKAIRLKAKEKGWPRPEGATPRPAPQLPPTLDEVVAPLVARMKPVDAEPVRPEAILDRGRDLVVRMMDELEVTTSYIGEMEEQILASTPGKNDGNRREAMMKAVSLSTRAGTLKNLALAAKTLSDAAVPDGKKKQRQAGADEATSGGGKFAQRTGPRLVANNS